MTSMGPGVGLEIGNSFFMYSVPKQFAYYSTRKGMREIEKVNNDIIANFAKAGYIDCIHTYADIDIEDPSQIRDICLSFLQELETQNIKIEVWTNHAPLVSSLQIPKHRSQ